MKRIKANDTVIVIAGKSKGHVGKVKKVADKGVYVEGANLITKHVKPNPNLNQSGGLVKMEAPLDPSNVANYNPVSKKADKIGYKFMEVDGVVHKVRYFKSNDEVIDRV